MKYGYRFKKNKERKRKMKLYEYVKFKKNQIRKEDVGLLTYQHWMSLYALLTSCACSNDSINWVLWKLWKHGGVMRTFPDGGDWGDTPAPGTRIFPFRLDWALNFDSNKSCWYVGRWHRSCVAPSMFDSGDETVVMVVDGLRDGTPFLPPSLDIL